MKTNSSSPDSQVHTRANFNVGRHDIQSPFTISAIEAAKLYISRGVKVFPLHPPGTGPGKKEGKVPAVKSYRQLRPDWCGESGIKKSWVGKATYNLAIMLPSYHLVVCLDIKADDGFSVGQWLQTPPSLQASHQVGLLGGRNLNFRCMDLLIPTKLQGMPRIPTMYRRINDDAFGKRILHENHIRAPPAGRAARFI